ncbi:MAG TPA: M14 family metallopeptidase [Bdellovibrionota bacterium]|nr:M14 family metallopeptidase [Bdellovibrionota bacterium]
MIRVSHAAVMAAMLLAPGLPAWAQQESSNPQKFVQVMGSTKEQRSLMASLGMSIEFVRSDSAWGFASESVLKDLQASGLKVAGVFDAEVARGGHEGALDFPSNDAKFHNYAEVQQALNAMVTANADVAKIESIGKSLEGRDLLAIHINTDPADLASGKSQKPGMIYMGAHHAREHLSVEMPLMLADHLLKNRHDNQISALLEGRDIWIIPMVNPDGCEYDVSTGSYKMWRKNRRNNGDGTMGVDLNRNYGFMWGSGGSSNDGSSDVFMGPKPFSEPETQAIRDFVTSHRNATTLLTFHTFSELILYPWGHKYDAISDQRDHQVFDTMARTMSQWNHYTPEQASQLYIASGDTTDWAYGELKMFAFTFEMSPTSMWQGGFYPGASMIDKVFQDNLRPALYMLDLADNPYRVLDGGRNDGFLKNYHLPQVPSGDSIAGF